MMDREQDAERLAAGLDVRWADVTVDDALRRLHSRRRRRRDAWRGAVAALIIVLVGIGLLALRGGSPPRAIALPQSAPPLPVPRIEAPVAAIASNAPPMNLGDGSVVEMLAPETRIETTEVSPSAVTIRLRSGSARFSVVHRPSRVFRVVSGDVSIIDVGTEFMVVRHDDASTVDVLDGVVRVEWDGGVAEVHAGERRVFPPPASSQRRVERTEPPPSAPSVEDSEGIEGLLASADEARLRGDAAAAVAPLRRAIAEYHDDPRAALAAFMLGRVYLDELHDPPQAAAAFAQARTLAAGGPLAEDALAREVEAWVRAGNHKLARERAREYLEQFPEGHRAAEVRRSSALP
jgi:transmembrane sensor